MQSQRHQESNLGSDDERRKRNVSRSMQKESSQKPRAERLSAVKPQNLGFDPVRNRDAPPVAAPVAQSTNTTTTVPAVAVENPYATLDPSENDVTPDSSMSDDDDFGSEDGTEDTAAQLIAKAMQTFDSHNSVIDGNAQISKEERTRVEALVTDSKGDTDHLVHQLRVTVKPSVNYQTGKLPTGKMANRNKVDPTSTDFGKDLEKLILQAAVHDSTADYSFNQAGRIRLIDGIPTAGTFFVLFTAKKYCSRVLAAKVMKFHTNYDVHCVYTHIKEEVLPFDGAQPFHCEVIRDLANDANTSIAKQEYIVALTRGQMDTTAFKGIERGQNQKTDGSGNKIHKHMSLYFDQTRTANHGMQEVHPTKKIDLMDEYSCCIPVPKFNIFEPPSYIAYKDSTGYIHKRDLMKSGDWCPYCWGNAHEKGYKCIYYNFCRRCLIFNPRDRKYKDLALTKHLCNYGITDMPKQKAKPIKKEEIIPEQVMDPQRIARLEAQQAQVNAMEAANEATMVSTSNLHFALQPPTNMICYRQGSLKRRNVSAKRRKPKPRRRIPRRRRNLERKRESTRVLSYTSTTLAHIVYNMYVEVKINYVLSKLLVLEYHKTISIIRTIDESRKKLKSILKIDENIKIDENHKKPKKLTSSKFNPRQGLEYHTMKSTSLTIDESRKKLKSILKIDENIKIDENYKKPKKMTSSKFNPRQGLEYHKMKLISLTLDENRKKFKYGGFTQTLYINENYKKIDENHNKPENLNSQFFTVTTRVNHLLTRSCNQAELKTNSHVIYHKDYG